MVCTHKPLQARLSPTRSKNTRRQVSTRLSSISFCCQFLSKDNCRSYAIGSKYDQTIQDQFKVSFVVCSRPVLATLRRSSLFNVLLPVHTRRFCHRLVFSLLGRQPLVTTVCACSLKRMRPDWGLLFPPKNSPQHQCEISGERVISSSLYNHDVPIIPNVLCTPTRCASLVIDC